MTQLGAYLLGNTIAFLTIILVLEPAFERLGFKPLGMPVNIAVCFGGTLFMWIFGQFTPF